MPLSLHGANLIADYYTSLNMWVALCTVTPTSSSTGATLSEVTEADYDRLALTPANWSAPVNGLSAYGVAISYSPVANWGDVNSWALVDSVTQGAGNVISYGNFSPVISASNGSYIEIPSGSIVVGVAV